jgi:hypothetical protein
VGFDAILSFGPDCRAKHQILRTFPKEKCPSSVFDWQVTPIRAVRFYLANDFRDTFDREDLGMSGRDVVNRKLRRATSTPSRKTSLPTGSIGTTRRRAPAMTIFARTPAPFCEAMAMS